MKTETKQKALKLREKLIKEGKDAHIYKYATKRKYQYFVGTWWDWMLIIS